jgi:hypothetical protein
MVRGYVDNVNMRRYINVDSDNIVEATMKMLLTTLWRTDARLTGVAALMTAILAATGVALLVDPREILGAPAWMKPAKFAASIAVYTLTLAWVFTYLPEWTKTRRVVSWVTAVTLVLEIVVIDVQAWRGTTSHFNVGTLLDGVLFTIMGIAIVVQTLTAVAVAVALWRQRFADPAIGWALRFAMAITIVGAMSGGLMTQPTRAQLDSARAGHRMTIAGAHTVGAPDGGPGLPVTGWSREHGDLRVAHFLGLHALQLLPLLVFLFARRQWHDAHRVRVVWALSASYVSLFALLLWQALRGQSVMQPDMTTAIAFGLWGAVTVLAVWVSRARADSAPPFRTVIALSKSSTTAGDSGQNRIFMRFSGLLPRGRGHSVCPSRAHGLSLRRHTFSQFFAPVRRAADDRQNGAPAARRHAGRLEHVHGLLPGDAARWIFIRTRVHTLASLPASGDAAHLPARRVIPRAAGRCRRPT